MSNKGNSVFRFLNLYKVKDLQHFLHILNRVEGLNLSIPHLRGAIQSYITSEMKRVTRGRRSLYQQRRRAEKILAGVPLNDEVKDSGSRVPSTPQCVKCWQPTVIQTVNTCRATHIGGDWRSVITCSSCHHQEYSVKYPEEILGIERRSSRK